MASLILIWNNPIYTYYVCALLLAIPVARIFMRAGFKPFWTALLLAPDAGLILCAALLAFRKWPAQKGA